MAELINPIKYHVYTGQDLPEPWPYDYVLDCHGLVKRASARHFVAELELARCPVAGLASYRPVRLLRLRVPRISARWLYRILDHARRSADWPLGDPSRLAEQMYHAHWCDDRWRIAVPQQCATAQEVRYVGGSASSVVLDIHSHHCMTAYFSQTDDRDEQGCRFYAVIGRIYDQPEIRLRLGVYGDFMELSPLVLFDGLGPFEEAC